MNIAFILSCLGICGASTASLGVVTDLPISESSSEQFVISSEGTDKNPPNSPPVSGEDSQGSSLPVEVDTDLQSGYEAVFGTKMDKRQLRIKKILSLRKADSLKNSPGRMRHYWRVRLPKSASNREKTLQLINHLSNRQGFKVEPDLIVHMAETIPNDPFFPPSAGAWRQKFSDLWPLEKLNVVPAWDLSKGSNITIAVIDTGVDYRHPDLAGKVILGNDLVNDDLDPMDDQGHGTHVAGIAAAITNNGLGIAGVAPNAKILAIKVLAANGSGYLSDICLGIRQAADTKGVKVINLSLGGKSAEPESLRDAIEYATSKNVVIVAAAGNSDANTRHFIPASNPNVISVAASSEQDKKCYFSNFGLRTTLTAPGCSEGEKLRVRGILSLLSSQASASITGEGRLKVLDQYLRLAGTSMASPYTAGVAALLLSQRENLTPTQVRELLVKGADDIEEPGFDSKSGWGRINAMRSLSYTGNLINVQIHRLPQYNNSAFTPIRFSVGDSPELAGWMLTAYDSKGEVVFQKNGSGPAINMELSIKVPELKAGLNAYGVSLRAVNKAGVSFTQYSSFELSGAPTPPVFKKIYIGFGPEILIRMVHDPLASGAEIEKSTTGPNGSFKLLERYDFFSKGKLRNTNYLEKSSRDIGKGSIDYRFRNYNPNGLSEYTQVHYQTPAVPQVPTFTLSFGDYGILRKFLATVSIPPSIDNTFMDMKYSLRVDKKCDGSYVTIEKTGTSGFLGETAPATMSHLFSYGVQGKLLCFKVVAEDALGRKVDSNIQRVEVPRR